MIRTQIQMTARQQRLLRDAAQREGVSFSEMVRRCIGHYLDQAQPDRGTLYTRAVHLVGRFADPDAATDLARRHDDYLDESYR